MPGWVAPEQSSLRTADAVVTRRVFDSLAKEIAALRQRAGIHVGPTPPTDTSLVWIDTSI
jgi:hypothetical protein